MNSAHLSDVDIAFNPYLADIDIAPISIILTLTFLIPISINPHLSDVEHGVRSQGREKGNKVFQNVGLPHE